MKLYTVADEKRTLVCRETAPGTLQVLPYATMNDLLTDDPAHRETILARQTGETLALAEVRVLAPIPAPRQDVICLGMNYQKHKTEAEQFNADAFTREKGSAVYFSKRAAHCPGPGDPIPGHFDLVDSLDYETELAVILGRDAKHVREEDAYDYVFGYTIVNDVSARNLQTGHKQWYFGKGPDGFSPMAPGPGHPHLDQRGTAAGRRDRRADLFHRPRHRRAFPGHDPPGRDRHRHRHPGGGRHGLRSPQVFAGGGRGPV